LQSLLPPSINTMSNIEHKKGFEIIRHGDGVIEIVPLGQPINPPRRPTLGHEYMGDQELLIERRFLLTQIKLYDEAIKALEETDTYESPEIEAVIVTLHGLNDLIIDFCKGIEEELIGRNKNERKEKGI